MRTTIKTVTRFTAAVFCLALNCQTSFAAIAVPSTPEEAVVYLLFGIENGADGEFDGGFTWRKTKSSPAIFRGGEHKLTVETKDNCTFEISKLESDGIFRAMLDLSKVKSWRQDGAESIVEGDGLCLTSYGECPAKRFAFQVPRIDNVRLDWNSTYAWLKARACKK